MTTHCYRNKNRVCSQNCQAYSPEAKTNCHIIEWFMNNYAIGEALSGTT